MQTGTWIAIYFVIWWMTLFMTLPFGVRSQQEAGDVVPGSEPGAPEKPHLAKKLLANSVVAAVVLVGVMWMAENVWS